MIPQKTTDLPIGIFDSGVGGLSVLRAIRAQMPNEPIIYLADQGHVPYGPRPMAQIQAFSEGVTRFLLAQGAKLVVVACNTASAAALQHLRTNFPNVPFVGMEPAIKPAAEHTKSGVVGVLATPATFQGSLYASAVARFAKGVTVLQDTCPGLVQQIEKGDLGGAETRQILEGALLPMLSEGADALVMGCTHYPFVIPLIQEICGDQVQVIDPAPAVAKQIGRLLDSRKIRARGKAKAPVMAYTTGAIQPFQIILPQLLGESAEMRPACWQDANTLHEEISRTQLFARP